MGEADSRTSQFRKGAVELAILALLARGELYGAEIVDRLAVLPGLAVTSGTVYPLLSRLKKASLVDSVWRESPVGPPRKYYRLAEAGSRDLAEMSSSWRDLSAAIDSLLEGVDSHA
ncbi:MAG: PadR family transcriptional regulator [Actinobacteria bacterium]|nr:MAG: PadR family transcriptional regulator [Actinomycetota bacterium]